MERRLAVRGRAHRLVLAGTLGVALLGAMPWSVAADESPPPESSEPTATTEPTPSPTASPEPTPAPAAAPEPTTAPASDPTQTPSPATNTPDPTATPTPSPPSYTLASINLYRSTAMVRQYTNYWCVPATVQSMANLILRTSNRSYSRQGYIYKLTRLHNRYRYVTKGNDPQGWAWSLRYFTGGRNYQARAYSEQDRRDQLDRSLHRQDEAPGRRHRLRGHPRLGGARLQADLRPGRTVEEDAPRPVRERSAGHDARIAGPTSTSPSPSSARSSRAITSGSAACPGRASGWSSPSDLTAGAGPSRSAALR